MGAPPKLVTITASRSFDPVAIELWKDVPLKLTVELGVDVEVDSAAFISFEIHSKREFSSDTLLARADAVPVEQPAPYEISFTGRQMNLPIADGRKSRQLHGVLYARYLPDDSSSYDESEYSSDGEDESNGELDILAIAVIDFQRHNASPSSNPLPTPPLSPIWASQESLSELEDRVEVLEAAPPGDGPVDAVRYSAQTPSSAEQTRARANLGLGSLATKSSVSTADLANGSVTVDKLTPAAVNSEIIADSAVGTAQLADAGVTASKLAADVAALLTSLAPKLSPAFSGTPTAPTAAAGTASTQIATTAFVATAVAALINGAPGALDALNELAAAMGNDPNFATTVNNALAARLVRASNLSDLTNAATARTNLGLGDLAVLSQVTGAQLSTALAAIINGALQAESNLSDLTDPQQARDSLQLGTAASRNTAAGGLGAADDGMVPIFGANGSLRANSFQVIRDGTHFSAVEFWNLSNPSDPGAASLDGDVASGGGGTWFLRDPANATQVVAFLTDLVAKADLDGGSKLLRSQLPAPLPAELGGVMRNTGTAGQFINGINADGSLSYGTPAGGGSPGGTDGQPQYRINATTFGGISGLTLNSGTLRRAIFSDVGLGTTPAETVCVVNDTAASAGAQQGSGAVVWKGRGHKTGAPAGSKEVAFRAWVLPVQGVANPSGEWLLQSSVDGAAYFTMLRVLTNGGVSAGGASTSGGFAFGGSTTAGHPNSAAFAGATAGTSGSPLMAFGAGRGVNANPGTNGLGWAMGDGLTLTADCAFLTGGFMSLSRRNSWGFGANEQSRQRDGVIGMVPWTRVTGSTPTELSLHGTYSTSRMTLAAGTFGHYLVWVSASKSDGSAHARFLRQVSIKNAGGTTQLVGAVTTVGTDEATGVSITIDADDTNDTLRIRWTGDGATWNVLALVYGIEQAWG